MRLVPREEKFFKDFLNQVEIIDKAANALLDGARKGNGVLPAVAAEIRRLEQQGDELVHDIYERLHKTFLTPLDPEDIHALASHLDDVLDGIEEAAHRLVAYRLDPIPTTVIDVLQIIVDSAKTLRLAFEALGGDGEIVKHCIEVNRQEDMADALVRNAISHLFRTSTDAIDLIKQKEVYEILEDTTDCCEDVADVLQSVVVKNS
jgi:uncharacterized protein